MALCWTSFSTWLHVLTAPLGTEHPSQQPRGTRSTKSQDQRGATQQRAHWWWLSASFARQEGSANLHLGRRVQDAYGSTGESSDGVNLVLSKCVQIFASVRLMPGAQAVLNAPVSMALLPSIFCQKGSVLAWCAERSCSSTTQIEGRQRERAKRKNIKSSWASLKTYLLWFLRLRKHMAGSNSALSSRV